MSGSITSDTASIADARTGRRNHFGRIAGLLALLFVVVFAALAPPAFAAPPANDARTAPQALGGLPVRVMGTTVDATLEPDEPVSACGPIKNSVWFSFSVSSTRELLVALDAAGDMDATVELFVRERSQLTPLICQRTNRRGEATIDADATAGTSYVVRVAPLSNSVADRFTLRVVLPDEPARPPGERLPDSGAGGRVDRFANPDDAWSRRMREGRTYRINVVTVGPGCVQVALYAAGEFGRESEDRLACDDHTVFTAPASGTFTLHVRAPRASRAQLPYRLRVGRAKRDDSAPGVTLADDRRVRGALRGDELDALDLYRFTLARRSDLRVRLQTTRDFDLQLLTDGGRQVGCSCRFAGAKELTRRLQAGRYFIAVRARDGARGGYALARLARLITRSRMLVDGQRAATAAPGETVALTLRVTPAVGGRASLLVERHDPIAGWLFHSRHRPRVSGTAASVAFQPPFVGRWRVTGEYDGTRTTSPSQGGTARFNVLEPLTG
jgi:hypothetical protein